MSLSIRLTTASDFDLDAVSRICLLTGDAGTSAEAMYSDPTLIGRVYSVPYAYLQAKDPSSTAFSYLLVSTEGSEERALGYIIGATDTRAFEAAEEREWWPAQRAKYPVDGPGNEADRNLYRTYDHFTPNPSSAVSAYDAHLHINILPELQGQGWGRRLINQAVEHIRAQGGEGVHLGIDPRNDKARQFYLKVGFKKIELKEGEAGEFYGLDFNDWV